MIENEEGLAPRLAANAGNCVVSRWNWLASVPTEAAPEVVPPRMSQV